METLWHITTRHAWAAAVAAGEYRAPSLAAVGFIHLSYEHQWRGALERFYRGHTGLVLLAIDRARLRHPVRDESADGDQFPHLYGPLDLDAVTDVIDLPA